MNVILQLLVNKTLYEKTLASGFGSVHFLLDASEQQQVSNFLSLCSLCIYMFSASVDYFILTFLAPWGWGGRNAAESIIWLITIKPPSLLFYLIKIF